MKWWQAFWAEERRRRDIAMLESWPVFWSRVSQPGEIVVKRERMENTQYQKGFDFDDGHPLWASVMEMLARLEQVTLRDTGLTTEQVLTRWRFLDEIRATMGLERKRWRQQRVNEAELARLRGK